MKRNAAKWILVVLCQLCVLTGCGFAGISFKADAPVPEAEAVEVKAIFPGEAPVDFDEVLAAVNDKLRRDGVGVHFSVQWVPWGEYPGSTMMRTAAGESFDLFLDAQWMHIDKMISDGLILALDERLDSYPNLKRSISPMMWEANRFQGKIYGIPLGIAQGGLNGFAIRKDLREKYGLPEVRTLEDLEAYLYAVKRHDPGILPLGVDAVKINYISGNFNPLLRSDEVSAQIGPGTIGYGHVLFAPESADPRIVPFGETPGYTASLHKVRQFYRDGILDKNVMTAKDTLAQWDQGKVGAIFVGANGQDDLRAQEVMQQTPGAQVEVVYPYESQAPRVVSDFKQYNFLVVNRNSKHPDKALELIDWISIQENHDLLEYGIEGKHWIREGHLQYRKPENSRYAFPGFVMTWRPSLHRTPVDMLPEVKRWFDYARDPDNFIPSVYIGFSFDPTPVKAEIAKLNAINDELMGPLLAGVVDPDEGLAQIGEEYRKAGSAKVMQAFQRQIDDFMQLKAESNKQR